FTYLAGCYILLFAQTSLYRLIPSITFVFVVICAHQTITSLFRLHKPRSDADVDSSSDGNSGEGPSSGSLFTTSVSAHEELVRDLLDSHLNCLYKKVVARFRNIGFGGRLADENDGSGLRQDGNERDEFRVETEESVLIERNRNDLRQKEEEEEEDEEEASNDENGEEVKEEFDSEQEEGEVEEYDHIEEIKEKYSEYAEEEEFGMKTEEKECDMKDDVEENEEKYTKQLKDELNKIDDKLSKKEIGNKDGDKRQSCERIDKDSELEKYENVDNVVKSTDEEVGDKCQEIRGLLRKSIEEMSDREIHERGKELRYLTREIAEEIREKVKKSCDGQAHSDVSKAFGSNLDKSKEFVDIKPLNLDKTKKDISFKVDEIEQATNIQPYSVTSFNIKETGLHDLGKEQLNETNVGNVKNVTITDANSKVGKIVASNANLVEKENIHSKSTVVRNKRKLSDSLDYDAMMNESSNIVENVKPQLENTGKTQSNATVGSTKNNLDRLNNKNMSSANNSINRNKRKLEDSLDYEQMMSEENQPVVTLDEENLTEETKPETIRDKRQTGLGIKEFNMLSNDTNKTLSSFNSESHETVIDSKENAENSMPVTSDNKTDKINEKIKIVDGKDCNENKENLVKDIEPFKTNEKVTKVDHEKVVHVDKEEGNKNKEVLEEDMFVQSETKSNKMESVDSKELDEDIETTNNTNSLDTNTGNRSSRNKRKRRNRKKKGNNNAGTNVDQSNDIDNYNIEGNVDEQGDNIVEASVSESLKATECDRIKSISSNVVNISSVKGVSSNVGNKSSVKVDVVELDNGRKNNLKGGDDTNTNKTDENISSSNENSSDLVENKSGDSNEASASLLSEHNCGEQVSDDACSTDSKQSSNDTNSSFCEIHHQDVENVSEHED
ncbi:hypothetical protein WDU94_007487, partial [Cyamophila willieti]